MLFQHVAIAGLAHIDAPRRLTTDEINLRLRPTLDRLGIKTDVIKDIAGVEERRLWDGPMLASDAATLAAVKALGDAGIEPGRVGLLVNTSVSRDYLEPSTASIVSGNLAATVLATGGSIADAAVDALKAGCDLLWIPGDAGDQEAAYRAVVRAVRVGAIPRRRVRAALAHVTALKRKYAAAGT